MSATSFGARALDGPATRAALPRPVPRPMPWVLAGLGATVLVAAGGWLLVLSPQADALTDIHDQTMQAGVTETQLTTRVAQLRQQFSDLPEYQGQLAALQVAMPSDAALPELVRAVRDAAATSGVQLTGLVPSAPVAAGAGAATSTGATNGTDAATADAATADADAAAATTDGAAAAATAPGLLEVPISITATGSYAALEAFLASLQQQDRLVRVDSTSLSPSSSGSDPSALALSVSGAVFALSGDASGTAAAVTGASVTTSPTGTTTPAVDAATAR